MKTILLVLACCGATSVLGLSGNGGLRVRWGTNPMSFGTGDGYFRELPQTLDLAQGLNWAQEERVDTDVLPSLKLYCHNTKIVCGLYDDTGYIAGIQINIPQDEFTDVPSWVDWYVRGFRDFTPSNGKTYWAIQQYFVNEEFLATPAVTRKANRNPNKMLQANGIWVRSINGRIDHYGNTSSQIYARGYSKKTCLVFMGVHAYINTTAPCTSETIDPFFTLTNNDELVGTGLLMFGKLPEKPGDWFERPPALAVKNLILPGGPKCLHDTSKDPGFVSMHIYYVDKPWTITCPLFG